jgi:hypothetical protein
MQAARLIGLGAVIVSLMAGCGDDSTPTTPTPPPSVTIRPDPSAVPNHSHWQGEATVVAVSNSGGCGWGRTPGETRSVLWRVTVAGMAISLEEDMANWPTDHIPFSGSLNGQQFSATYTQHEIGICQFRGGTLTGTFSEDFSEFNADETLVWGQGTAETRVLRRWHARKL